MQWNFDMLMKDLEESYPIPYLGTAAEKENSV